MGRGDVKMLELMERVESWSRGRWIENKSLVGFIYFGCRSEHGDGLTDGDEG
jgi:hypothetical protein